MQSLPITILEFMSNELYVHCIDRYVTLNIQ